MDEITKDPAYQAAAPGDFAAMLNAGRYGARTGAFDAIIAATHDHFWDPLDPRYIDFSQGFDLARDYLINPDLNTDLKTPIGAKLDEAGRVKLVNLEMLWALSSILHGEQGALLLSASLCHVLKDPGAQEYAANQAREEARHVTAFARYIGVRWGAPSTCGPVLVGLLEEMVRSPPVWKKVVGMQMLIEGLAMGALATIYQEALDPLLARLAQLVMTDEAFHHKFGKLWADRTVPQLSPAEHAAIEDWAALVFRRLLYNLTSPDQKQWIYRAVGLDPAWCLAAFRDTVDRDFLQTALQRPTHLFRVLAKTLLQAGIITARTRGIYATYIDLASLSAEGESTGEAAAREGLAFLKSVKKPAFAVE